MSAAGPMEAGVGTRSVLLADDTEDLRLLLRILLESGGSFTVVAEATNGAEAIDLAEIHRPDIVLLDLAMPVMGGLEALPEILRRSPRSKVAVLSGFEAERLAAEALALGASAYLEKGMAPRDIVDRLTSLADGT